MTEKVILGEAADHGLAEMIAVAEVNRGSLKGFSSTQKDLDTFSARQPKKCPQGGPESLAFIAPYDSTQGATHFDNIRAFGMPRWAKDMVTTAVIADMHYFREKRNR